VPILVQRFVEKLNAESGKHLIGVHPEAMELLKSYEWPGNIRELRNTVERAVILCEGDLIGIEHLPPEMTGRSERSQIRIAAGLALETVEKEYILYSLERNRGNKARTAEALGISEKTLYNKLHRYAAEARAGEGEPT
jgi:two-component system response regulator HydG